MQFVCTQAARHTDRQPHTGRLETGDWAASADFRHRDALGPEKVLSAGWLRPECAMPGSPLRGL
jgi:hypothetical protein